MKQFIISLIFVISCAYGLPIITPNNVDSACWPELNNVLAEIHQCFNLERFNTTIIREEAINNLVHYSGDETALREFSVKYCNVGYDLLDCLPIYFNITPTCQPMESTLAHSVIRSARKSWDFNCDNNAEEFVQMVTNNGIQLIADNYMHVAVCGRKMNNLGNITDLQRLNETVTHICEKFKEVLACHIEWMELFGNSHLIHYINGSYGPTIEELGCL